MHALPARAFGSIVIAAALLSGNLPADPVPVRHPQGSSHGFLALRTLDGKSIATGDASEIVHGDRVTSHLVFRFRDGSIDDDTTVSSNVASSVLLATTTFNAAPRSLNPSTSSSMRPPGRLRLIQKTEK